MALVGAMADACGAPVTGEMTEGGDMEDEEGGAGMGTGREEGGAGSEEEGRDGSRACGGEGRGCAECSVSWPCWVLRLDWLPDLGWFVSGLGGGALGREPPLKLWQWGSSSSWLRDEALPRLECAWGRP